jgi:GNAT superfamily N-acetyltransferase
MRAKEFVADFEGINIAVEEESDDLMLRAMAGGREMGHAYFVKDGQTLLPQDLEIDPKYQGQGIAAVLYDYAKSLGYEIRRSNQQTDAGKAFWQRHKPGQNIWEVNFPDELSVSDAIQDHFYKRGYKLAGEGRDQMAFISPRNTVVKVLGIGESEREEIVKRYVAFFVANQRNPYYPKIYNTGEFTLDNETYFVYEMEYLDYVANEEVTLEYLEDLMKAAARGYTDAYQQNRPLPPELDEDEIQGLLMATEDLMDALGGHAPLDLSNIENIRRRSNGHLVIMDPFSL